MEKVKNKRYKLVGGNLSNGDKYIIGDSHVKTFHSGDMECIEDRNNGAIKIEYDKIHNK